MYIYIHTSGTNGRRLDCRANARRNEFRISVYQPKTTSDAWIAAPCASTHTDQRGLYSCIAARQDQFHTEGRRAICPVSARQHRFHTDGWRHQSHCGKRNVSRVKSTRARQCKRTTHTPDDANTRFKVRTANLALESSLRACFVCAARVA